MGKLNWHQKIALEMARRDRHYANMDEWFRNHPPESGDIILKDSELPYWMRKNYKAVAKSEPVSSPTVAQPTKTVTASNKPQGVEIDEWLQSTRRKSSQP